MVIPHTLPTHAKGRGFAAVKNGNPDTRLRAYRCVRGGDIYDARLRQSVRGCGSPGDGGTTPTHTHTHARGCHCCLGRGGRGGEEAGASRRHGGLRWALPRASPVCWMSTYATWQVATWEGGEEESWMEEESSSCRARVFHWVKRPISDPLCTLCLRSGLVGSRRRQSIHEIEATNHATVRHPLLAPVYNQKATPQQHSWLVGWTSGHGSRRQTPVIPCPIATPIYHRG